jgi:hypothetical protein
MLSALSVCLLALYKGNMKRYDPRHFLFARKEATFLSGKRASEQHERSNSLPTFLWKLTVLTFFSKGAADVIS